MPAPSRYSPLRRPRAQCTFRQHSEPPPRFPVGTKIHMHPELGAPERAVQGRPRFWILATAGPRTDWPVRHSLIFGWRRAEAGSRVAAGAELTCLHFQCQGLVAMVFNFEIGHHTNNAFAYFRCFPAIFVSKLPSMLPREFCDEFRRGFGCCFSNSLIRNLQRPTVFGHGNSAAPPNDTRIFRLRRGRARLI
jgi:hypothetical protein